MKFSYFALVLVLCGLSFPSFAHQYTTETADPATNAGNSETGMALDSNGLSGICYRDAAAHTLKFARYDGANWNVETADDDAGSGNNLGYHCALVFDDQDRPNIVYFDMTAGRLMHVRKDGGIWQRRVVDPAVLTDFFADSRVSLQIAADGTLGTAYYDSQGWNLRYAEFDGAAWNVAELANAGDVGHYPSLAYDSDSLPGIAFLDKISNVRADLVYLKFDGTAWLAPETVDDGDYAGMYASLVFDANDTPHAAYVRVAASGIQSLNYKNRNGGVWGDPIVIAEASNPGVTEGLGCTMVIGAHGNLHIFYREEFASALFGHYYKIKLASLYFADQGDVSYIMQTSENIDGNAFNAFYNGLSVAIDGDDHLAMSWTHEVGIGDSRVYATTLTSWSPAVHLLTPDAQDHAGDEDGVFEFRWLDFDPDSNARVELYYLDENWQVHTLDLGADEDDADGVTGPALEGTYTVYAQISDDDFATSFLSVAPAQLTVDIADLVNLDPENLDPENFDPENFDPENFDPENFDPENFDPENFDPENFDPENFDPENLDPENLDPENFDPENFDPENFDPENFDPENFDPANSDPENFEGEDDTLANAAGSGAVAAAGCSLNLDPRSGDPRVLVLYALLLLPLLELRLRK